jgi:hypothetical protein
MYAGAPAIHLCYGVSGADGSCLIGSGTCRSEGSIQRPFSLPFESPVILLLYSFRILRGLYVTQKEKKEIRACLVARQNSVKWGVSQ